MLTGTRFFSSLQFRLFSPVSEKSSMKRRCQHQTFDSITKVKPWQPTFLLGRFFVTGKPFRPFFFLTYFNWRKFSYNASIGKWGRVKTWNRFLGVLVLSLFHLRDVVRNVLYWNWLGKLQSLTKRRRVFAYYHH